jgi:hypothetical protein
MSTRASLLLARTPRSAFGKLLQNEGRYARRQPAGLVFGVAAPVLVLVIMGAITDADKPVTAYGGLTAFKRVFPGPHRTGAGDARAVQPARASG